MGFASTCTFRCANCGDEGSRSTTYRETGEGVEDRCPGCGSDDIEVRSRYYDPEHDSN